MPKEAKREEKKMHWSDWVVIAALTFAVGSCAFLLVKHNQNTEMICNVRAVDQLTGLVALECVK